MWVDFHPQTNHQPTGVLNTAHLSLVLKSGDFSANWDFGNSCDSANIGISMQWVRALKQQRVKQSPPVFLVIYPERAPNPTPHETQTRLGCGKKQEAKEAKESSTPPATVFGLQWCLWGISCESSVLQPIGMTMWSIHLCVYMIIYMYMY